MATPTLTMATIGMAPPSSSSAYGWSESMRIGRPIGLVVAIRTNQRINFEPITILSSLRLTEQSLM